MKVSLRPLCLAWLALVSSASVASCGSEAESELEELGELKAELRIRELSAGTLELGNFEPEPPPPPDPPNPDCDCGPLVSRPPPECPSARWFCNAVGVCGCEPPSSSVHVGDELAPLASSRTRDPGSSEPAQGARTARANLGGPELSDLPLRTEGEDPECKCLGATVSPPQGGCSLVDWFCNASGLCRCRS